MGSGLSRRPVRRPIVQALRHSLREERAIMDEGRFSISASDLYRGLGTAAAPLLIDVRRSSVFEADEWIIASAVRGPPEEIERWGREIAPEFPVVVYCGH